MNRQISRRRFLMMATVLLGVTACGRKKLGKYSPIPAGSTILALGDSLTFGYGVNPPESYPSQLAMLSGWKVVNGGVSGDKSDQALARLPALLESLPKLVLLSIGGNDFLKGVPEKVTRANIEKIIHIVQEKNIPIETFAK